MLVEVDGDEGIMIGTESEDVIIVEPNEFVVE